MASHGK